MAIERGKKGQVTLFIIIAIVIVAAGVAGYSFYQSYQKAKQERIAGLESDVREIRDYIDSCTKISAENVTLKIGKQSGYYEQANPSTIEGIAYYFNGEENLTPTLGFIEDEINKGFNKEFQDCLGNFSSFKEVQITTAEPQTSINTDKDNIEFTVELPVTISKKDVSSRVDYLGNQIIKVRLKSIYDLTTKIVEDQLESEYIYLTRFQELPKPEGINVTAIAEEGISVFNITDFNATINNETYSFLFAGKI